MLIVISLLVNHRLYALKEVIFAGNNFPKFREFWAILPKLIVAKYLARTNPRKLIITKNTKQPNFQAFFKLMTKKKIEKKLYACVVFI